MKLVIAKDYEHLSRQGAIIMASQVLLKPNSVLGLATGSTPLGTYKELIAMHRDGMIDFSKVVTFNLDEYLGLDKADPNSYNYFMNKNLFDAINIKKENTHIPCGVFSDEKKMCDEYETQIDAYGGIDLQLLGIGRDGHIGFNEPDAKFMDATHVVDLNEQTINDNSRFFGSRDSVPRKAVSMGIRTIMKSKEILLEASGLEKAEVLYKTVMGPITPEVPASALRLHPNVTIIADLKAAGILGLAEGVYNV
ncbi:MAG: glucosamine-6-phosphate deaminase [Oscillospiraceae bacterium]|nr:glucosamine-6-phosphate deaminase [Oscillospiraceae bacterium]